MTTTLSPADHSEARAFAEECGICLDDLTGETLTDVLESWADLSAAVDDYMRDAFVAFVANDRYWMDGYGVPDFSSFEDAYAGEWASFREYAENLADDLGMLVSIPDEVARYFDWDMWTRDLAYDYTTEPAPGGGVFVFRSF